MSRKLQTAFLIAYALSGLSLAAYAFRYELGLKKPSFKRGECVAVDMSNEFQRSVYKYVVMNVGKKEYQTYTYGKNDEVFERGWLGAELIFSLDDKAKKVPCPPIEALTGK